MPGTAFLTSVGVGTCCCHSDPKCRSKTGMIVSGSPDKITDGLPTARIGDVFLGTCGHVSVMVSGSPNVITNGLGQCRIGDVFSGCLIGVIVSGSPDSITN